MSWGDSSWFDSRPLMTADNDKRDDDEEGHFSPASFFSFGLELSSLRKPYFLGCFLLRAAVLTPIVEGCFAHPIVLPPVRSPGYRSIDRTCAAHSHFNPTHLPASQLRLPGYLICFFIFLVWCSRGLLF